MNKEQCSACKKPSTSTVGVFVQIKQAHQFLCLNCYNDMMAEHCGIDFDNVSFNPITLKDSDEVEHSFNFQTRLIGYQVIMEAKEDLDDDKQGYHFSVLGDADDDLFDLFKVLFERMRRALRKKHIQPCQINKYRITDQDTARGYIMGNREGDRGRPLLVIDGKEIEWHEFGRMLSTYEGFNFKLEIFDKTEEK